MDYLGHGVMRILVTGAQGFLGCRVVSMLRTKGVTVIPTGLFNEEGYRKCDLLLRVDVRELIRVTSPDRIVHCAAHVPKVLTEYADSRNAGLSLEMLDNILAESACPIIYISSMTVYGKENNRAVHEEDAGEASSEYGRGKWEGEKHLEADGRVGISVRIPGLFGLPRRQGIVYNVMFTAKYGKKPLLPPGPLMWAAMHVDDAAESIAILSTAKIDCYEAVNVGYCGKQSIGLLLRLSCEAYNRTYDYDVTHPSFEYDLTRAKGYGAVPSLDFREALFKFGNEV